MPTTKGIDVSSWNGVINWEKVKASGVSFAMLRVGAATRLDRYFVRNIQEALRYGIPCGAYLYSYASTPEQAAAEAAFVLSAVRPYALAYPVAYDIEDMTQHPLTNAQRTTLVTTFCDAIQAGGLHPCVYTSLSWFNTMLDLTRLHGLDKWVAQWGPKCTFAGAYTLWQNSNMGTVPGIRGNVDLNFSYTDYPALLGNPLPALPAVPLPLPPAAPLPPKKGAQIVLNAAPLFATAHSIAKAALVSGVYWLYDGQVVNGRLRITNSAERVARLPLPQNVTGFVRVQDVQLPTPV